MPYVVSKATLAVVRSDKALVYSAPRDVKITSRYISNMTIVAMLQEGSVAGFANIQCYDIKQGVLYTDSTFVTLDTLTTDPADVNATILYTVAAATKNQEVKKNLLTIAVSKYGSSVFMPKLQQALGGAPAAKPTVLATGSYIVNYDRVNVRDSPDEVHGKVVAQLQSGIVVEVPEATAQSYKIGANTAPWHRIEDPEGWVFGASLAPAPEGYPEEIDRGGEESPQY